MKKGFNLDGFMRYLEQQFSGFENCFLRETVENIIEYGQKHEHVSKDQFAYFISDILPEVEFGEIAMFCDDDILTADGQQEKRDAITRYRMDYDDALVYGG